ncbi:hypothetical protein ACFPOB_27230 [Bosea eneae]|uniref:Uncharacterized protein n=1 Tax=Bosea eneae TaxID=151454 RepID=A0ABW0J190_9HYPH
MFSKFDIAMSASVTALFISAGRFAQAVAFLGLSVVLIATREEN